MDRHTAGAISAFLATVLIAVGVTATVTTPGPNTELQSARRLFEAGRYAEAAARFRQIKSTYPAAPEAAVASYYIGLSQERQGDRTGAVKAYNEMLSVYGNTSDLADFARKRIREVEENAGSIASEASSTPPARPSGAAVDALARNVVSDILDRSLPPQEPDANRRRARTPVRTSEPATTASRSIESRTARLTEDDARWPSQGGLSQAGVSFPSMGDALGRAAASSSIPATSADFPPGTMVPILQREVHRIEFPAVPEPQATRSAAPSSSSTATASPVASAASSATYAPAPSGSSTRAGDRIAIALPLVTISGSSAGDRVLQAGRSQQAGLSEPGTQGGYAVSYIRRRQRSATAASTPLPVVSVTPSEPVASTADAVLSEITGAPSEVSAPALSTPVSAVEMEPAARPEPIPEAAMPRVVPAPTLIISSEGVADPFALGIAGGSEKPPAPRVVIPPIRVPQSVGTVLASDLFRFRQDAGPSTAGATDATQKPVIARPEPTVAPPPPVSRPVFNLEPVPEPVMPASVSEMKPPRPARTPDAASEAIAPASVTPAISNQLLESLTTIRWEPASFAGPVVSAERAPTLQQDVSTTPVTPVMPLLSATEPTVMMLSEPSAPSFTSSSPSPELAAALQPGATFLGSSAPISSDVFSAPVDRTTSAIGTAPVIGTATTPQTPQSEAAAPPPSTSPSVLPAPLYTISVESLRRDLAAEATAASATFTSPAPAAAPQSGLASGSSGGPQRLIPMGTQDGGYRRSAADPLISKALGFRKLGMDDQAIAVYREALTVDPRNPLVKNNLADILVERGEKIEEAVDLLQEALQEDVPDRGPYFSTLGWAYMKLGDYANAEKFLNEALRGGVTAGRFYRRGRLYAAMGMAARARADLDRALVYSEDTATSEMIRQALQELRSDLPVQGTARNVR